MKETNGKLRKETKERILALLKDSEKRPKCIRIIVEWSTQCRADWSEIVRLPAEKAVGKLMDCADEKAIACLRKRIDALARRTHRDTQGLSPR